MGFSGGFQAIPDMLFDEASNDNVIGLYARIRKLVHVSNVSELIPTKTKYASNLQGVIPWSVSAYARHHRTSHTTVNRWLNELQQLGLIEVKRRKRKSLQIRLKPWGEIPGYALQNAAHEFKNGAEQTPRNNKEIPENQNTQRSSAFKHAFKNKSLQGIDINKDISFLTQGSVQARVQEELIQEYKKNLEKIATQRENSLPGGSLVSDSGAEAPSSAPGGALKGQKVGLTAEAAPELAEVPEELNGGQCEVPHDSKIGELAEGGAIYEPSVDPVFQKYFKNPHATVQYAKRNAESDAQCRN